MQPRGTLVERLTPGQWRRRCVKLASDDHRDRLARYLEDLALSADTTRSRRSSRVRPRTASRRRRAERRRHDPRLRWSARGGSSLATRLTQLLGLR